MFVENKNIDTSKLPFIASNESWLEYQTRFSGYNLSGFDSQEAGLILSLDDSTFIKNQNKFHINYGVNNASPLPAYYNKQLIKIRPQQPVNNGYLSYFSNDQAWATYDVSTGMITGKLTSNNVFSYAIDIVVSGVLSGNFIYTGETDISTETGRAFVYNSEKTPILYIENFNTLSVFNFNGVQNFCKETQECEESPEPELKDFCFTGDLGDTGAFQKFLLDVALQANTTEIIRPNIENSLVTISGDTIKYNNLIFSGYLLYNGWSSGDSIDWSLYNFDFVKLYSEFHKGNLPPYPNTGFKLYYPNDFDSLDSLVDKLNEKIDIFATYPIWYPYECLKDSESGIFLTGKLMEFFKNTGSTGELPMSHFNNRIDFISSRSFPQLQNQEAFSYKFSVSSQERSKVNFFSGFNYLIPSNLQLEGFNKTTQEWEVLDSRNNLSGDFAKLERIKRSIESLSNSLPQEGEEEEEKPLTEEELPQESGTICKEVILIEQQRVVSFNENPLCPPQISFKDLIVTVPKEECKKFVIDKNGNLVQQKSNAELCAEDGSDNGSGGSDEKGGDGGGGGAGEGSSPIGDYYVIRTGWNLNAKNLNNQSYNSEEIGFDINKVYDKYKVSLSGFFSYPERSLLQKDSFFVQQVNLYTLDTTGLTTHSADPLCTIGADYVIDVEGIFPIEIDGFWNYNLVPEESGIYRFFKTPFVREIEDSEREVVFNKVTGRIVSPSGTGFLTTSGFGVVNSSYTNSDYYFYNPTTQSVYFTESLTGIITGSGVLSGEKLVVKQSVINQELLRGGRLSNSTQKYHEITSDGTFNSTLENVEYVKYDVLGFYPLTGTIIGNTVNGELNINNTIIVTGSGVNDIYAYYPVPTGFTFSEVSFATDYNNLKNFETLTINGNTIIYHDSPSQYPAPNYFNTDSVLISIINESSGVFLCTGILENPNIRLNSTIEGTSGNIDITSNSIGIEILNYISGKDLYPRLYKIVTETGFTPISEEFPELGGEYTFNRVIKDPVMTGNLSQLILGTGFYYSSAGSGDITGEVLTFTGSRSFFDVWDIATGNLRRSSVSFLENSFISGTSYIKNTSFGKNPTNVNLRAFYLNYLNISNEETSDVADLIIKDLNTPNLLDSGVIFRLNGLK
jgi:hypothetical protein